jgi:hypothetical protein
MRQGAFRFPKAEAKEFPSAHHNPCLSLSLSLSLPLSVLPEVEIRRINI